MKIIKESADVSILIILFAIMFFGVFVFPITFVQDDWNHLFQVWGKKIIEVLNYFKIWENGNFDNLNYYRPLSTKLYYFLMEKLFGFEIKYFVWANWFLFFINGLIINRLIRKFTKNILLGLFLYSFSLVWFTVFSYISICEVLIFTIFSNLAILNFINKKYFYSILFYFFSLLSRETAIIIPIVLFLYSVLFIKDNLLVKFKNIFWFLGLDIIYLFFRFFVYGLPNKDNVYDLKIGFNALNSLLKYSQWSLNISGIFFENKFLLAFLVLFLFINLVVLFKFLKIGKDIKIIVFGFLWWVIFLVPVLFFENHIDPWNLIPAIFGFVLILITVWDSFWSMQIFLTFLYFILFFVGLLFYRKNYWTSLRQNIVLEKKEYITKNCNKTILFEEKLGSEVDFAFYGKLGPKIMCNNKNLEVFYAK